MHRQIPLAYLQYFPHLSQGLPRSDRPESLLYGPEIPPWASLPLSAPAAIEFRRRSKVFGDAPMPTILRPGLGSMCLLSPLFCVDSLTLPTPPLLK
jgi:hypothetical protein